MNRKNVIISIILILALIGIVFTLNDSSTYSKLGSSQIKIPEGYKVINKSNHTIRISSNNTTIIIDEKNETIEKIFNKIKKNNSEYNVNITELHLNNNVTLKNITVIETEVNKNIPINYYYEKNNKTYQIFIKGNVSKDLIEEIINNTEEKTIPWL